MLSALQRQRRKKRNGSHTYIRIAWARNTVQSVLPRVLHYLTSSHTDQCSRCATNARLVLFFASLSVCVGVSWSQQSKIVMPTVTLVSVALARELKSIHSVRSQKDWTASLQNNFWGLLFPVRRKLSFLKHKACLIQYGKSAINLAFTKLRHETGISQKEALYSTA